MVTIQSVDGAQVVTTRDSARDVLCGLHEHSHARCPYEVGAGKTAGMAWD